LHDRYHPARRNPFNEVECGDHYARSMASYGVYLAACGYEYHGPKGHLGFAPRLAPDDFRCAFTAAQGWGSYRQKFTAGQGEAELKVAWGALKLRSFGLTLPEGLAPRAASVLANGRKIGATIETEGRRLTIRFESEVHLAAGQGLRIALA
jgi:non-lysosomal glucosylceramidase